VFVGGGGDDGGREEKKLDISLKLAVPGGGTSPFTKNSAGNERRQRTNEKKFEIRGRGPSFPRRGKGGYYCPQKKKNSHREAKGGKKDRGKKRTKGKKNLCSYQPQMS